MVGGGQTPGATMGNGRAVALTFAREGARVLVVDRDADSAEETAKPVCDAGGTVTAHRAYTTSKAAVHAMTRSLALEYAPHGVRVNAVAPGMMDTPMGVDANARAGGVDRAVIAAKRAAMVPMGHQGTSQDVADAALFLAPDESAFITGTVLPVDGGFTLRAGSH
ncbi:SDR family NAD(P)-dependent oxidoreductase [Streptomyces ochraceiscleroticus]|uniref:SDR family NAD(P)-dependent oxidoreductase n=1 Tax=Streptomyces ochraceiscleroticus TaxID=47761 RepID=A0ABW1MIZ7_9ACTN|nr:SDR family oxidoreductase [Streptomyces ochraceiscleroticus]